MMTKQEKKRLIMLAYAEANLECYKAISPTELQEVFELKFGKKFKAIDKKLDKKLKEIEKIQTTDIAKDLENVSE